MKRKEFLRWTGFMGAGAILGSPKMPVGRLRNPALPPDACVLIPTETAGPFPLDLSANTFYFRQDIRENRTGVLFHIKMRIIGANNCLPMQNVRVNIWHCDKDGNYSGYATQLGQTYLRGYQMTDANGEVTFTTIFPGWYTGRICHIHFQVYVSTVYAAISQLTFPIAAKNQIYADNSSLYTKGADPLSFNQDNIFSDGYDYQVASLSYNATTGAYESFLEVAVQGSGVSALAELQPETGGQFKLMQNFPNPYRDVTTVPFNLINPADVRLEMYDLNGKLLTTLEKTGLGVGDHSFTVQMSDLGIPNGSYAYQLVVSNDAGVFRQVKLMTAQ